MEPIKQEFQLSDAMVGFLTGTVLAVFFVISIYPAGILTDRFNRKRVVLAFGALFSVATTACGLSIGALQFAVTRIAIGVAEAGTTPPSLSMLADKFPASQRPMAMTIFTLGAAIGAALGSGPGGWLSDHYGWRSALIVFGLAGIPLLLVTIAFVREPKRGVLDKTSSQATSSAGETLRFIWRQKSLIHVIAGGTVVTFWAWGLLWWTPAFYHRSFGMTVGDAGSMLGSIHLVGGTAAVLLTVLVMRWLGNRDVRLQLVFLSVLVFLATFPSILAFGVSSASLSVAMMWLFIPVAYLFFGPNFGAINNLVPASMRGQAIAIYLLTTNFANLAIAPQVVGWASDYLTAHGHDSADALRIALMGLGLTGFWGVLHYLLAIRHIRLDLARLETLE